MGRGEKRFNKRLIGLIIGSTILGVTGLSMTPKGRGFLGRMMLHIKTILSSIIDMAARLGEKVVKKP